MNRHTISKYFDSEVIFQNRNKKKEKKKHPKIPNFKVVFITQNKICDFNEAYATWKL